MLKEGKTELTPVLCYLFNLSLHSHTYPDRWKLSKVTPLFKSGNHDSSDNYRPISILPTVGKMMERLVHSQCTTYLKRYHILNDNQYGFRSGHSTGSCLADFLHNIYGEVDKGGTVGGLYIDLSKAFDSVDHEIMLIKLKSLGF